MNDRDKYYRARIYGTEHAIDYEMEKGEVKWKNVERKCPDYETANKHSKRNTSRREQKIENIEDRN